MAMQISPQQSDWLTKFLAQNVPAMTPDMAINTAGAGASAEPGLMERFDGAVNDFGKMVFGSVGHVGPSGTPNKGFTPRAEPPEPVPVPAAATPQAAPTEAAAPAPAQPGLMERFDGAVNDFGKMIFGSVGHVGPSGTPNKGFTPQAEPPPEPVPVPGAAPPQAAPSAPPAAEPGFMDRLDGAVNDLGKAIFGDAGH